MKLNKANSAITRILGCALLLTCLTCLGASPIAPGHSLPNTTVHGNEFSTLNVSQSVSYGAGGAISNSIIANLGQLIATGTQIDVVGPNNVSATLASSLQMWVASNYGTQTQGAIVAAAKNYLVYSAPNIIANLKTALASTTAKTASYQYSQTVQVTGIAGNSQLVWTLYIDPMGKALYGDPIVIPGTPVYISATYTPLAVGQGLPQGWQYPNAGTLQYQVIQISNGQPVGAVQTINVGGAYDAPAQVIGGAAIDPDAGLKCLLNKASSGTCVQGNIDIATVISNASASYAFVNYVRALTPVYSQNGNGTSSPTMSINYNQRILHVASCTSGSYENIGTYGYVLNQQTDRYFDLPTGQYSLISSTGSTSQSPTQSFDLSKAITGSQSTTLASQVIDFLTAGNPLVATSQIPQIGYLAPITQSGYNGASLANWTSATRTYNYASVNFSVSCDFSTGTINLWAYWSAYWGQGQHFVDGGTTTPITTVGQAYPVYVTWFGQYWPGGIPYIATLDASNNLWISKNGDPWTDYNGHWETASSESAFDVALYYAYPQLQPDYALENLWNANGEYYTHYLLGFNLTTGQPITTVMDLGDDCAVYGNNCPPPQYDCWSCGGG